MYGSFFANQNSIILKCCRAKTSHYWRKSTISALLKRRTAGPSTHRATTTPTGAAGDDVGRELDLIATWKLRPACMPAADRITLIAGAWRAGV
jgi:hypothetical protein